MAVGPLQLPSSQAFSGGIDWSPLANLGNVYKQAQQQNARQEILQGATLDGSPESLRALGAKLVQSGDVQGGLSLAQMAEASSRDARDFGFRTQEAQRTQGNTDRSFKLQERTADEAARGFDYREVDDGNGGKTLVRIDKASGNIVKPPIEGQPTAPTNPYAYGKQNESQSKDSGFANRMFRAEGVLRDPGVEKAALDPTENIKGALSNGTGIIGGTVGYFANKSLTPEFQKYDQAKRDFINAVLRRESGAAIAPSEFDNANKQYFPQPGDAPERIAEKRRNRQDAIAGVAGGGGQSYKPPFTFGQNGEMVATGNPVQGATPGPQSAQPKPLDQSAIRAARSNPQGTIAEAQAAVKGGADPAAVIARLKSVGIPVDPSMFAAPAAPAAPPQYATPEQRQ